MGVAGGSACGGNGHAAYDPQDKALLLYRKVT
jgi:hypothetical protein